MCALRVLSAPWVDLTDHRGRMEAPHRMVPQARLDLLRLWDLTIPGLTTRGLLDHSKSFDFCVLFGDMNDKRVVCVVWLHLFLGCSQWSSRAVPTSGLG